MMNDEFCKKLTINYLLKIKTAFVSIQLLKKPFSENNREQM